MKRIIQEHSLKCGKEDFIQGEGHLEKCKGHCGGVWYCRRELRFYSNIAWARGNYSQGEWWGSRDGKLFVDMSRLRENSEETELTEFLLKTGQGDQTSPRYW